MLKKDRAKLARRAGNIIVVYCIALYTLHRTMSDTEAVISNSYNVESLGTPEAAGIFGVTSILFDYKILLVILGVMIATFIWQIYQYINTTESFEDNRQEELKKDKFRTETAERATWRGIGTPSDLPKGLLSLFSVMLILGGLYLYFILMQ